MRKINFFPLLIILLLLSTNALFSEVKIEKRAVKFRTYPFSDPDPVAKIGRIYPYFRFDGFSDKPAQKRWNMIVLSNEFIEVWIAPEIGGKVWGAIDNTTGIPFIYFNRAIKFRDIAMRGPWTSGGIEFNFGAIGHTPNVATPVDRIVVRHKDGSISVFVGAMDLSSRTEWQVEIKLSKGKAYFETNTLWFNPTNLDTSFYHWLNGSTDTGNDLKYFFPGKYHLDHNGNYYPWPIDKKGRDISYYKNNNFGKYKPYHIFGTLTNYFSVIFQSKKFGAGHWGFYTDKPGKKIWMWGLSREGAIWEELLSDQDLGNKQYTEIQAGALFIQAGETENTPFKHLYFSPQDTEISKERWFLVKGLKEITKIDEQAAYNIKQKNNFLKIEISPFEKISKKLKVISEKGKILFEKNINLIPLKIFKIDIKIENNDKIRVFLGQKEVYDNSSNNGLQRPVKSKFTFYKKDFLYYYRKGLEKSKMRYYDQALKFFLKAYELEPRFLPVLTELSEIYYRRMQYDKSLYYSKLALSENTFNPKANFYYALSNEKIGNIADAKDGFSIAAKDSKYRSASFYNIAEIYFKDENFKYAEFFAKRSLNWNKFNINAYRLLTIIYRKKGLKESAKEIIKKLLSFYPLSHFSTFEYYLISGKKSYLEKLSKNIKNEFPYQTYLELALYYYRLGLLDESLTLLNSSPKNALINYWISYLYHLKGNEKYAKRFLKKAIESSPFLIFPFREESLFPLKWALSQNENWKTKYYLGLLYWSKYRIKKAKDFFLHCGNNPDYPPFYLAKAKLFEEDNPDISEKAYLKAYELNKKFWRTYHLFFKFLTKRKDFKRALLFSKKGTKIFKNSFTIKADYAEALYHTGKYKKSISTLKNLKILPSEAATFGRTLYNRAHIMYAIILSKQGKYKKSLEYLERAKLWPENLGAGKPYDPDNRVENFLTAQIYERLNKKKKAVKFYEKVIKYTIERKTDRLARKFPIYDFFGYFSAKSINDKNSLKKTENIINSRGREFSEILKNIDNKEWIIKNYKKASINSQRRFFFKILLNL